MVSSLLADALSDPSGVLQSLYQKNREADNFPHVVFSHFASIFVSDAEFQQVRRSVAVTWDSLRYVSHADTQLNGSKRVSRKPSRGEQTASTVPCHGSVEWKGGLL